MTPEVEALRDQLSHRIETLRKAIDEKRVDTYLCEQERRRLMMGKKPAEVRATLGEHKIVLV
jgi:hypothetical protein